MTIHQLKPVYKPTLEDKIERLRSLHRRKEQLTKAYDMLKDEITTQMADTTEAYNTNGECIATFKVEYRALFDRKSFDVSYPGVYQQFAPKREIRVFRLK